MISAVVPVFNEQESLEKFYPRLYSALSKLDKTYEIIFVDDGSTDSTLLILKKFAQKDKNVRIFSFRRNQGKAEALTLGFKVAKGDYIVTLDADLQDKPEEIRKLLGNAKEGFDLVCGWRKNRKDPLKKRVSSKLFNFIISIFGVKLHDYNCGLKVYTKEAAKSLNLYGGMHRFIPLLVYQEGFSVSEVSIEHDFRKYGKSKYGFSKLWRELPDIFTTLFLTRYAKRPLHFFGVVGGFFFLVGTLTLIYLSFLRFAGETIGDRPLLLFGIFMVIVSFQILFTGFLADLMIHTAEKNNSSKTGNAKFILKYQTE